MLLYQHVYGRVARGYSGGSPGYQLAALSEELAGCSAAVERMNELSFFHFREGSGKETRLSFYRPAPGYLAFGCSRWARDKTRSIGAFAHHFICREDDFLRTSLTPVTLLEALKPRFYESEEMLPDRKLPAVSLEELQFPTPAALPEEPQEIVLHLLDFLRGEPTPFIPMVVASEESAWSILHDLYSRLHRTRIVETSFSTLFVEAGDFAAAFRLVFVPERRHVNPNTNIYHVFDSNQSCSLQATKAPITEMWRVHPQIAHQMIRFFDLSELDPENLAEGESLINPLLSLGTLFRRMVEYEKIPQMLLIRLLLSDFDRAQAYWQAGAAIPYLAFRTPLWEKPDASLPVLLQIASWARDSQLRDDALLELARFVSQERQSVQLVERLDPSDLEAFFRITRKLPDPDLQSLANRFGPELRLRILEEIASRILGAFEKRRSRDLEQWLRIQCQSFPEAAFPHAAVDFINWYDAKARYVFRLDNYRLSAPQYRRLLELAWNLCGQYLTAAELVASVYHGRHRCEFLSLLGANFSHCGYQSQVELLQSLMSLRPEESDYRYLIEAVRRSDRPIELARYLSELVQRYAPQERSVLEQLQTIYKKPRWKIF